MVADVRDVRRARVADTVKRMWWTRKGISKAARAELDLARGERVLAVARTSEGAVVAATTLALHLPPSEASASEGSASEGSDSEASASGRRHRRVRWELVDHAGWQDGWLRVRETGGAAHRLRLPDPGSVPEAVQERVTATVVVSTYARLTGSGGVRIVGRRDPDGDGLNWTFVFDPGLDPADPDLRARAEGLLEELRRQTGV